LHSASIAFCIHAARPSTSATSQQAGYHTAVTHPDTRCISTYLCRCARLLLQNALSPFAVPAGLGPTVHCCTLALLYCTALETSHSLMLSPRLMGDLWPTCEQVMLALHCTRSILQSFSCQCCCVIALLIMHLIEHPMTDQS